MKSGWHRASAVVVLVLGFCAMAHAAPLYVARPYTGAKSAASALPADAKPVEFNRAQMLRMKPREEAELALPDGSLQSYVLDQLRDHGDGVQSWIGHHKQGGRDQSAVVTTGPAGSYAYIASPRGDFRVLPSATGDVMVAADSVGEDIEMGDDARRAPAAARPKAASGGSTPAATLAATAANPATIDLMVVYTPGFAAHLGANLATRLNYLVTMANQAYAASGVFINLRLVKTVQVAYNDSDSTMTALSKISPDCTAAKSWCGNVAFDAATFGSIETLRTQFGADVVALMRDGNDFGGGGVAWVNGTSPDARYMYSSIQGCMSSCEFVFIHEVGHNMGNMHDRATVAWQSGGVSNATMNSDTSYQGAYPYSYGYAYCSTGTLSCNPNTPGGCGSQPECGTADGTHNYAEIMAYFHASTNRNYKFSSPAVTCSGSGSGATSGPCGVAPGSSTAADTVSSMNNTAPAIAALKVTMVSLAVTTTTTLASSLNPSAGGGAVTLTATVASGNGTPTGSVSFTDNGVAIAGCSSVALVSGVATCATTFAAGAHPVTAAYAGTSSFLASTSAVFSQVATGAKLLTLSVSPLDFGGASMSTTSLPLAVQITNNTGAGVTVTSIVPPTGFNLSVTNCVTTIPNGGSCNLYFTMTPGVQGPISAVAAIVYTGGPTAIRLAGVGEKSLVTHYYNAILNRAPDATGKAYWEGEAARMSSLGADINETWFVMAGYFFNSPEYLSQNKSDAAFVTDLYNTFFNRPPDSGGLNYWVSQIQGGLPREVVLFSFMFSNEFVSFTQGIFGNTASRAEVNIVMDFFRGILNRLPDTSAFQYWLARIRAAQCAGAGPVYTEVDNISSAFIFNPEYANRNRNNTQLVTDMYYSFLRRGGDTAGVQYWINQLNTHAMDVNTVRFNFLNSPEFGTRVQAVIAAGCAP